HLFRDRGVKRGDRVGLFFPKSVQSVACMLGALKAGAMYVPIDPQAPPGRVAYITRNCEINCLVTTKAGASALEVGGVKDMRTRLLTDASVSETSAHSGRVPWEALDAFADTSPAAMGVETDLAYILYTSGSTGVPKGVMISHRNALTFVDWCATTFAVRPDDRLSNHAPLHFDLSVFDIYNALVGV